MAEGTVAAGETGAKAYNRVVDRVLGKPPYARACALLKERGGPDMLRGGTYQVLAVLMVHSNPMGVREMGEAVMGRDFGQLPPKNWASKRLDAAKAYTDHATGPAGSHSYTLKPSFKAMFPEVTPTLHRPDLFRPTDTSETASPDASAEGPEAGVDPLPASAAPEASGDAASAPETPAGTTTFFGVPVRDRDIRRAVEIRREGIRDAAGTPGEANLIKYSTFSGSGRWQAAVHGRAFEDARRGAITATDDAELARFESEAERDDVIQALEASPRRREPDHLRLDQAPPHAPGQATHAGGGPEPLPAAGPEEDAVPTTAPVARATGPAPPADRAGKRPPRMQGLRLPGMAAGGDANETGPGARVRKEEAMADDATNEDIDVGRLGFSPGPAMMQDGHAKAGLVVGSLDAMVSRQRGMLAKLVKFIIGEDRLREYLDKGLTEEDLAQAFQENGVEYDPKG